MNKVGRLTSILICSVVIVCTIVKPINVYASDTGDYKKFLQGDSRWGSLPAGSGHNISSWGCLITSLAMIMAYADPSLRDVNTFNPGIAAHGDSSKSISAYLQIDNIGCYYDSFYQGPLKFESCVARGNYSVEDNSKWAKKQLEDGKYIMVYGSGVFPASDSHFSVVTGWSNDKNQPIVWDVATGPDGSNSTYPDKTNWEIYCACGLVCYTYSSSSKSAKDTILGNDTNSGTNSGTNSSSKTTNDLSESEKAKVEECKAATLDEWELNGMPTKSDLVISVKDLELASNDSLNVGERQSMAKIQKDIEDSSSNYSVARIIVSFVGLILIVYSLILASCFMFDTVNTLVEGSLISVLTFGKVRLLPKNDEGCISQEEMKEMGYVSNKELIIMVILIMIIGLLMVSGVLEYLLYRLIVWVRGLFI